LCHDQRRNVARVVVALHGYQPSVVLSGPQIWDDLPRRHYDRTVSVAGQDLSTVKLQLARMHLNDQRRASLCEDSVGGPKGCDFGSFDVQLDEVWNKSATVSPIVQAELTDLVTDRCVHGTNQIHQSRIQRKAVCHLFDARRVTLERSDRYMSVLGNYK
jgi:hypothetical protein